MKLPYLFLGPGSAPPGSHSAWNQKVLSCVLCDCQVPIGKDIAISRRRKRRKGLSVMIFPPSISEKRDGDGRDAYLLEI